MTIEFLTYDKRPNMSRLLDSYLYKTELYDLNMVKLIVEYMADTVLVDVDFYHHDDTHDGEEDYASDLQIGDYNSRFTYELDANLIKYDGDDIDIDLFDFNKKFRAIRRLDLDIVAVIVIVTRANYKDQCVYKKYKKWEK